MAYKVGKCLLQDLLDLRGMDQTQLALKMGRKPQQINKYITNRQRMSLEVAKNIASLLHCQMEDLYEWIEVGDNE
ncbi:helix-turn-helix domain-containing protein [Sporosarcina highlanderae]|uniref:Helix-turn-helix transcriptional regulator n=1 Tax=Sporosarcina highlanderae TaxID=3035916 RepID=A0ABT8JX73_9BACL|nr:helix-turn-helix transcriptional regulator [Sporosarcina highlanderae]MDN4609166.1 helix-turn-helix transcriptional regulator [Sporosarcina highlanderae]